MNARTSVESVAPIQHLRPRLMEISGKSCRLNRHAFSYAKGACRVPRVPPLFAYSFENELGWKNVFDIELMSSIGRSAFGEVRVGNILTRRDIFPNQTSHSYKGLYGQV